MKQNKAYKFRIYPNEEQKILFAKTFGCTRFIYNKMLSDKIDYYKQTKQKLNNTPSVRKYKSVYITLIFLYEGSTYDLFYLIMYSCNNIY